MDKKNESKQYKFDDKLFKKLLKFTNASNRDSQESIKGVYFDNGKIIGTTGYLMVVIDAEYPKELEGRIIGKNKVEIFEKFPNWKMVLPKEEKKVTNVDVKTILKAVEKIKKIEGLKDTGLKIGNHYYNSESLYNILSLNTDTEIYKSTNNYLIIRGNGFYALLTPFYDRIEYCDYEEQKRQGDKMLYTIEDALEYKPKTIKKIEYRGKIIKVKILREYEIDKKRIEIAYSLDTDDIVSIYDDKVIAKTYSDVSCIGELLRKTKDSLEIPVTENFKLIVK